jgi:hypothetical protein
VGEENGRRLALTDCGRGQRQLRPRPRKIADGLVESGHLTAVEDVDGGYILSDELGEAIAIETARRARQAESN